MHKRFLLIALLLFPTLLRAQGRLLLDEAAARKNLLQSTPPTPPPGVHATGKVVLLVEIAPDGHVASAKADTGNSRLREAAVEAVKTWRFKPFTLHSAKVPASTKLTVEFGPELEPAPAPETPPARAAEDDTPNRFTYLEDRCRTLVTGNAAPAQQAKTCAEAAELADHIYGDQTFVERRAAYIYASTALGRVNNLKAAIAYATKAVEVAAQGHDTASGISAAYAARGQAEAFAGDLDAADRDLDQAESAERKALAEAAAAPDAPTYHAAMKSLLLFHAQLLKALDKPDQAAAKTAEAAKL